MIKILKRTLTIFSVCFIMLQMIRGEAFAASISHPPQMIGVSQPLPSEAGFYLIKGDKCTLLDVSKDISVLKGQKVILVIQENTTFTFNHNISIKKGGTLQVGQNSGHKKIPILNGKVVNNGHFINNAETTINGKVVNNGHLIDNAETTINGKVVNNGHLTNNAVTIINNEFDNRGTLDNISRCKIFLNAKGASITSTNGTVNNHGEIRLNGYGTYIVLWGKSEFTNHTGGEVNFCNSTSYVINYLGKFLCRENSFLSCTQNVIFQYGSPNNVILFGKNKTPIYLHPNAHFSGIGHDNQKTTIEVRGNPTISGSVNVGANCILKINSSNYFNCNTPTAIVNIEPKGELWMTNGSLNIVQNAPSVYSAVDNASIQKTSLNQGAVISLTDTSLGVANDVVLNVHLKINKKSALQAGNTNITLGNSGSFHICDVKAHFNNTTKKLDIFRDFLETHPIGDNYTNNATFFSITPNNKSPLIFTNCRLTSTWEKLPLKITLENPTLESGLNIGETGALHYIGGGITLNQSVFTDKISNGSQYSIELHQKTPLTVEKSLLNFGNLNFTNYYKIQRILRGKNARFISEKPLFVEDGAAIVISGDSVELMGMEDKAFTEQQYPVILLNNIKFTFSPKSTLGLTNCQVNVINDTSFANGCLKIIGSEIQGRGKINVGSDMLYPQVPSLQLSPPLQFHQPQ